MKVLLTMARPLFPPDSGGKIRSLNIFSRLAKRVEIHAVSLAHPTDDAEPIRQMKELFASYTPVFWHEVPKSSPRFYADLAMSRLSRFPYFLGKYRVPELRRTAERVAAEQGCDVLLCDFLQSAVAMLESPLRPRVIFQHNVEYVIRRRHWEVETNLLKKTIWSAEWRKARIIEKDVCQQFDHVFAVSEIDASQMKEEFGSRDVTLLPTGVDVDFFAPQAVEPKPDNLVFVGSMDWQPNEDGVEWFLREVFPRIQKRVYTANVTIVGRNPSARLRSLACDGTIEITGRVGDVRPYVARAAAVVVPLRVGGGTRIKIFEAMAMAKPVISTTLGAEGLCVTAGTDIFLADGETAFADNVVRQLQDPVLRERTGRAARAMVNHHCTWSAAAGKMHEVLAEVCHGSTFRTKPAADADL